MARRWEYLLALVPLLGLVELALHGWFAQRAPGFDDYAALAPELLALKQPGEPVVVAPGWAEPLVRQAAETAFPLAELARADDLGFARFLEVSLLGAEDARLAEFPVLKRKSAGPFEIRVRKNPSYQPTAFDFVGAVERGELAVFRDDGGSRTPCPLTTRARSSAGGLHGHVFYPRRRFECPGGRLVGVTLVEDQAYRPRRCVLAQPPEGGRLVLRFATVPRFSGLRGHAGFSYFLGRDGAGGTLTLGARAGGRELGSYRHRPEAGWARFEFPGESEGGALEISLHSNSRDVADFCFALEARP